MRSGSGSASPVFRRRVKFPLPMLVLTVSTVDTDDELEVVGSSLSSPRFETRSVACDVGGHLRWLWVSRRWETPWRHAEWTGGGDIHGLRRGESSFHTVHGVGGSSRWRSSSAEGLVVLGMVRGVFVEGESFAGVCGVCLLAGLRSSSHLAFRRDAVATPV